MFMMSNKAFGVLSGLSFAFMLILLVFASNANAANATTEGRINRYVVAVSANNGGAGRPMLRYAESDAIGLPCASYTRRCCICDNACFVARQHD